MFYEYQCVSCGYHEEKSHGMNEEPLYVCPDCKSVMKRIITGGSATHYKGIGWSSNGTAVSPRATKSTVHELYGPKFMKDLIRK